MSLVALLKKKNKKTTFTTPSHGGKFCIFHKFYQWYKYDISEIEALNPEKALEEAERKASSIYGTKYTKFLTNGSTSGILGAVLTISPKKILIWDNAHPCHKNSATLSNSEIIEYSLPFDNELGLYRAITPETLEMLLETYSPDAIIITSPTYEGFVADVKTISNICHKFNTKLIVDEAHGALYPFSQVLPESAVKHADFTVQSLHKTAGGINPTALLHSNTLNPKKGLQMINTTSPSYPMLATIEKNINYLNSNRGRKQIAKLISYIKELRIHQLNDDPTKILLKGGDSLAKELFDNWGLEDEKSNDKTTLLLCGIGTDKKMITKLNKFIKSKYNC